MRPSKLKQMWKENKPVTLGWISMANSFSTEVMARQGFDALCIDLQHGATGMSDLLVMLQAISQTDTTPVVRVPWNDPATIMKALDLGAYAIIVPLVSSAEEAAKAVAACRYPPTGMRSSGPLLNLVRAQVPVVLAPERVLQAHSVWAPEQPWLLPRWGSPLLLVSVDHRTRPPTDFRHLPETE